jgi:hypothetical protein
LFFGKRSKENDMQGFAKLLTKAALVTALAAGTAGVVATAASADVACNRYGDCWHTNRYTTYPSALGVILHDEAWAASHRGHRWHWRDNPADDHGYYDHGVWRHF